MADEFDLSGAVDMLKEMLSGDEGKAQIQNILSALGGESPSPPALLTNGMESAEAMLKIGQIMSLMNNASNAKQTALLSSLRELLKPERRAHVDSAIKFLSISKAIKAFKELEEV